MNKILLRWGSASHQFLIPSGRTARYLLPPSSACKQPVDDYGLLEHALDNPINSLPLEDIPQPGEKVAIIVSDRSRAWQKPQLMLKALRKRLHKAAITDEDIIVVLALGLHRPLQQAEITELLGPDLCSALKIINHDAYDPAQLVLCGQSIALNRTVAEADRRIVTAAVSFHGLAGFSGGRKMILPGVAGAADIQTNHSLALDEAGKLRPQVGPGLLKDNPVAQDMDRAARILNIDYYLAVVVDGDDKYTAAFSGDIFTAQEAGVAAARAAFETELAQPASLVLASVGGFPRDLELYQSMKAINNAISAALPEAPIILWAECRDGFGPAEFKQHLQQQNLAATAESLRSGFTFPAYLALKLMNYLNRNPLILISGLPEHEVKQAGLIPARNAEEALCMALAMAPDAFELLVMPQAAVTVPVL